MTLKELAKRLNLECHTISKEETELSGGYVGDLLSDVMANACEKDIWLTIQVHENIVAVALLTNVAGIIVCGGRQPLAQTVARATEEGVGIYTSPLSVFDLSGQIYRLLVG